MLQGYFLKRDSQSWPAEMPCKPKRKKRRDYKRENSIIQAWTFVFEDNLRPLRHSPDVYFRHNVPLVLGLIWAVRFLLPIGSYLFLAVNIREQSVIIAAEAVTAEIDTVAAKRLKNSCAVAGGLL